MARSGRRGFTLLEMVVAAGILMLLMGAIGVAVSAMTQGTASAEMNLQANAESERALLAMVNDLQTTDTVGKDSAGQPYFRIQDRAPGTRNSVVFRRVEGYIADPVQDLVTSVYGAPIQYFIDDASSLVREQSGDRTVVANKIASVRFDVTASGRVTIELVTFAGRESRRIEASNRIQITPRNTIKI